MQTHETLRLGSRDSALALAQTNMVAQRLHRVFPHLSLKVETYKTQGDQILDTALANVGGKGLFVRELEIALLDGRIDVAIHSLKDMPAEMPEGLALTSVLEREDPRDVLISRDNTRLPLLPPGSVIGTSSLRREAQFRRLRPDVRFEVIRGNLHTRYKKLFEPPYNAIILAAAGVHRLNWNSRIAQYFDAWHESVPAAGQGILAAQYREDDTRVARYIQALRIPAVDVAQRAERAVLGSLEAGCHTPLGVHCRVATQGYEMKSILLRPDGKGAIAVAETTLDGRAPEEAGMRLAEALLRAGGRDILDSLSPAPAPAVSNTNLD
jgi:hydroxymethylbilane synthase